MCALARDTWVVVAMMRDGLDMDVEEEGSVQLSNWAARWRMEGGTEGHAYRRTQYKRVGETTGWKWWFRFGHLGFEGL